MRIKISQIKEADIGKKITIKGWVKTIRHQKTFSFIELNDGSMLGDIQIIADENTSKYNEVINNLTTGSSISIYGKVVKSPGKEQSFEIKATEINLIGKCDAQTYPLQKKRHSFKFLRTIAHLRPRTNTIGAVTRIRSALAFATHKFFQEKGFLYINTPIITQSDCEGAGEMFTVTTLDLKKSVKKNNDYIDYSNDFFSKQTFLTVSGQLELECYTCSMSDVYRFDPGFRAENSNTSRHLAEFWMVEPEMAFADLNDDMDCAEEYLKYCIKYALDNCENDLALFDKFISKNLLKKLESTLNSNFERLPYTKAVQILEKVQRKFEFPVKWGTDLQSEHERYLVEEYFKKPVIVVDYPKEIKAFYMRNNDDGKTVAAMDVLVEGVGEIIGGSQREERLEILESKIKKMGVDPKTLWWYLELRKYGTVPHAGFGLGFERLILFITGMENIRDVNPFPRYPGHAEF